MTDRTPTGDQCNAMSDGGTVGPCVLPLGHDESFHEAADGKCWLIDVPERPEPTGDLRERLANALHCPVCNVPPGTACLRAREDNRQPHMTRVQAADPLLPVVEAEIAKVEAERDDYAAGAAAEAAERDHEKERAHRAEAAIANLLRCCDFSDEQGKPELTTAYIRGQLGRDAAGLLDAHAESKRVWGEYPKVIDRLRHAEAELAALHDGETEPSADRPGPAYTPSEWLWWFNHASTEERFETIERIYVASRYMSGCIIGRHEERIQKAGAAVQLMRAALEEIRSRTVQRDLSQLARAALDEPKADLQEVIADMEAKGGEPTPEDKRWVDTALGAVSPSVAEEEPGTPIDWEGIVRQRERELKCVGEARHQAEAAVQRVRALCSRGPGPNNEYQIWTVDVLAALDQPEEHGLPVDTWTVSVEVPLRLPVEMRHDLFTAVANAVGDWEPDDRDGWDAEVSGSPTADSLRAWEALATVRRVRDLHRPHDCAQHADRCYVPTPCVNAQYCSCGDVYPCPTIAALARPEGSP